MRYNSFLPAELMYLFRELPSKVLNQLELYEHALKTNNLKQISLDISRQFKNLLNELSLEDPDNPLINSLRLIYYCTLAISDQWQDLFEIVALPTNIFEGIWRSISHTLIPIQDLSFFKSSAIVAETQTHEKILHILNEYSTGSTENDPGIWLDYIESIIESDYDFVNNHFIEFTFLLRILSVPFSIISNALPVYEELLYKAETMNMEGMQAIYLVSIGTLLINVSQYTKALEYYDKALQIIESLDWELKNSLLNNKGIILLDLGRYDDAEEIYRHLVDTRGGKLHLHNLANILMVKCKYEEALVYAKKNITEPEDTFFVMRYDLLHEIYIHMDMVANAKELEPLAKKVRELRPIPPNKIIYEKMIGRRHHHQGNLSLAKAQNEKALDIALEYNNLRGILNLYSLLIDVQTDLYALKSDDEQVRNELYSLINNILQLSDEQGLPVASIEILQLRAEAYIQDEMLEEARKDLFNATKLAIEFEFDQLEKQSNERLQEVISMISEDKPVKQDQSSLINRFKHAVKRLVSISPSKSYKDVETEVHGVLIITNHGTNVYSKYLSNKLQSEPALISGLISAVSSFITEIASGTGFLKSIMHDDMSLILEPVEDYIIICIAEEETFAVREMTRKFAKQNKETLEDAGDLIENGEVPYSLETVLEKSIINAYGIGSKS